MYYLSDIYNSHGKHFDCISFMTREDILFCISDTESNRILRYNPDRVRNLIGVLGLDIWCCCCFTKVEALAIAKFESNISCISMQGKQAQTFDGIANNCYIAKNALQLPLADNYIYNIYKLKDNKYFNFDWSMSTSSGSKILIFENSLKISVPALRVIRDICIAYPEALNSDEVRFFSVTKTYNWVKVNKLTFDLTDEFKHFLIKYKLMEV
jgi:hypothetical protein